MKALNPHYKHMKHWVLTMLGCSICFIHATKTNVVEAAEGLGGPPHIGTFEGSTTFTTTSSNGVNPGLYLEVMDSEGNYTEYTSEDGIITVPDTREGAYVTQAKLLGKTKYVDQVTGEVLDQWEDGRDLRLVSSEGPGLTTIGKNLFNPSDLIISENQHVTCVTESNKLSFRRKTGSHFNSSSYIQLEPNTKYWMTITTKSYNQNADEYVRLHLGKRPHNDSTEYGGFAIKASTDGTQYRSFTTDSDAKLYINGYVGSVGYDVWDVMLEKVEDSNASATPYEPYKSNILTVNEPVELRGIGDVRDELNLITGEVMERIGEIILDENGKISLYSGQKGADTIAFRFSNLNINPKWIATGVKPNLLSIMFPTTTYNDCLTSNFKDKEGLCLDTSNGELTTAIVIRILKSRLISEDVTGIRDFISKNKIEILCETTNPTIKTVSLNSTHYFEPVLNREITVNGTVLPLVLSVTIPTEPLSFTLDPNQEEGQQFVAPDFSITNHTPASISLELKAFEQTTQVFNDVLPTAHENWHRLDKFQSKDLALALVPKPSKGWVSLDEGPRYVADDSNYALGRVEAGSTVGFTFHALHGRAFGEALNPQYRLAFEFGF